MDFDGLGLCFVWGRGAAGAGWIQRVREMSDTEGHEWEIHKESIQSFFKKEKKINLRQYQAFSQYQHASIK